MKSGKAYISIDLKSFYASVECQARGLDPLKANLLVADESRTDKTICLAVSPSLKAIGVPGRPRLFEAKQKIREYEAIHSTRVEYIIAPPRMYLYEKVSAQIYGIYLGRVAQDDIHSYSIDECFIDATGYLHLYGGNAQAMASAMIKDVLGETGITATVGIGTNLYLAKVAMDILAKKAPPDEDGVRIAGLDEKAYCYRLWDHMPLTDFWQIGPGKARRLARSGMFTMGDLAERSIWDEEYFYRTFGIDGEIMIDHAWGIEPVTIADIKSYRPASNSLSNGQVLSRPYQFSEARLVLSEMIDQLSYDMFSKNIISDRFSFWVSYDPESLVVCPGYTGPIILYYYNRLHPAHTVGTVRLREPGNIAAVISEAVLYSFDRKVNHRLLVRRLGINADNVTPDDGTFQFDLFTDYCEIDKEQRLQRALQNIRRRYGPNAVIKGKNLLKGGTAIERNMQIGGHKA